MKTAIPELTITFPMEGTPTMAFNGSSQDWSAMLAHLNQMPFRDEMSSFSRALAAYKDSRNELGGDVAGVG